MSYKILAPAIGAFLTLAIGGSAGVALADGYAPRGKVAYAGRCSGGMFSGPYIGINAGVGLSRTGEAVLGNPDFNGSEYSVIVGGQAGYNLQCGNLIVGVETDINYVRFDSTTGLDDPLGPVSLRDEIDWFGTVRGRVGIAIQPNAMLYATAGLAYATVTQKVSQPGAPFFQSNDETKTGWTIGGGLELVHFDRWLIKAEALYVDLGDNTRTYTLPPTGCGAPPCTARVTWDDSFLVARLGFSYKFTRDEPVPLK
jgi:outer membrane immunogenic protein